MSRWKLKDFVLLGIIAVVFGIIYNVAVQIRGPIQAALGPFGFDPLYGIWFIAAIVAMYIIRKPGAALLGELLAALVEAMIGGGIGPRAIINGFVQGIGSELIFAITRYQSFHFVTFIAAGMGAAITKFAYSYYMGGYSEYFTSAIIIIFTLRLASGAIVAGAGGVWIGHQLYKTGALNGYKVATDKKEGRA